MTTRRENQWNLHLLVSAQSGRHVKCGGRGESAASIRPYVNNPPANELIGSQVSHNHMLLPETGDSTIMAT